MSLRAALEAGRFAVTTEVGPPKGADPSEMLRVAETLRGRVDALNVTDNQAAVMRLSVLAACVHLARSGFDPILQMTCRDRNRLAIQSDLLGAASFGITEVLALTGDHVMLGDHPQAKGVFDIESVQLLQVVRGLADGRDSSGNPLAGPPPALFPGAVVTPDAEPLEPQLAKFEMKVEAGARFFQTQAVYDAAAFGAFMERVRPLGVKVLAGVVVLRSAAMASFMDRNIPGISVPQPLIDALRDAEDPVATGVDVAARFIRDVRDSCDGVHIMAVGGERLVPRVLDEAGLTEVGA